MPPLPNSHERTKTSISQTTQMGLPEMRRGEISEIEEA
jgi:hypothetical protein